MKFRPTLSLYIGWQFISSIATAFAVIIGIIMLVDFVELSRNFSGQNNIGMVDLFIMTALKAPQLIEETLPFVVLFGAMGALNRLNRRSELIIMRAAGLSAWRFLMPGLCVAALLGVFWTTTLNPIAANSAERYESYQSTLIGSDMTREISDDIKEDLWLREGNDLGQTVIHAKIANIETRLLTDVTLYQFIKENEGKVSFTTRYDAQSAELTDKGYWVLRDVIETINGRAQQPYESLTTPTILEWTDLREAGGQASVPQFWALRAEIDKVQKAGFSATSLITRFHRLLALPLTLIGMTIIAAGVAMQLTRLGGTLRLIVIGAAIGFGVYFANNLISAFGETGALPTLFAAWFTPCFIFLCGVARLCMIEDG